MILGLVLTKSDNLGTAFGAEFCTRLQLGAAFFTLSIIYYFGAAFGTELGVVSKRLATLRTGSTDTLLPGLRLKHGFVLVCYSRFFPNLLDRFVSLGSRHLYTQIGSAVLT